MKEAQNLDARMEALHRFWFLADAPMFIDGALVERLYDAIFRPEVELISIAKGKVSEYAGKLSGDVKAGGEIALKLPPALSLFKLDIASGKASAELSGSAEATGKRGASHSSTYAAIRTPERDLEKLISLYVEQYPQRLLWVKNDLVAIQNLEDPSKLLSWADIEGGDIDKSADVGKEINKDGLLGDGKGPRPMIVLDLDAEAMLMPTYGELTNGKDCELLNNFLKAKADAGVDFLLPKYPTGLGDTKQARTTYWEKVTECFDSLGVLRTIETASGDKSARFDWIDFRLLCKKSDVQSPPMPPHLHFMPRGEYPSGIFSYHLVRRAHRFGIRIVGTLKKGQDINVLAVYER